jgi:hypothetical protein
LLTIFSYSREVRELSLSRRDDPSEKPPPAGTPVAGTDSHPVAYPYYPPHYPPSEPGRVPPNHLSSKVKTFALIVGAAPLVVLAAPMIWNLMTAPLDRAYATSSPSSGYQNPQSHSNPAGGPGPGPQYQNQQRSVDHGKRADFFGEPHSSQSLNDVADGVLTTAGPSEAIARSISDNNR